MLEVAKRNESEAKQGANYKQDKLLSCLLFVFKQLNRLLYFGLQHNLLILAEEIQVSIF